MLFNQGFCEDITEELNFQRELSTELKNEREANQPPRQQITRKEADKPEDEPAEKDNNETYKQEESLTDVVPDPGPMETKMSEEIPSKQAKKTSVWKRARQFLGLRKPKKWKKSKEPACNGSIWT